MVGAAGDGEAGEGEAGEGEAGEGEAGEGEAGEGKAGEGEAGEGKAGEGEAGEGEAGEEIDINLVKWEDDTWKYLTPLAVDPKDPSNIERLINDYMTRGIRAFNTYMRMISPEECFQIVVNNRTHTILLIAEDELAIDRMHESVAKLHTDATKRVISLKRKATEDLSHTYHARKMVVTTDGNELP
ncbi:hypothetical protein VC83_07579 [Pseudogymnoascus destructans]|uniref:Uncharacterized protein n=1 Tax=Pseudogymnoascus destructans TaxID=655981 RepID=A0A177A1N6_9PEZI|nr:uncharacterized protein VC83_07579 [Pseudogymnoascus destructans]OAF55500.1 hypothetical protein VC83_07579 [Pseudogymnoascus destructans]